MVLTANVSHDVPPLPAGLRSSRRRRVANELNTTAIHAVRVARRADAESGGPSAERLSLLSVLVFAGPRTMSQLARAEQVTRPAITRIVAGLEAIGLVTREDVADDRRSTRVSATAAGRAVLEDARRRRVEGLAEVLRGATAEELDLVSAALAVVRRGLAGGR
jgi:DNA-binding MarR family transcriptional regulator